MEESAPREWTGRPVGSGATTLRVQHRHGQRVPARLYIGRRLWQEIGRPGRVGIARSGQGIVIRGVTSGGYAVCGIAQNTQPRISIGMAVLEGLELAEGYHAGRVEGQTITTAPLAAPVTRQRY